MSTLAHVEHDEDAFRSLDVVKVVTNPGGHAVYFSRAPLGGRAASDGRVVPPAEGFLRHVGLYVYREETLQQLSNLRETPLERLERLEQLRALVFGIRIRVVITPYRSRGVDTPGDLAALERDWDLLTGIGTPDPKESPR
jgi:3-deoxy-manno-octulosonate cytidylyltransferase (CMP-KDO synthetase)